MSINIIISTCISGVTVRTLDYISGGPGSNPIEAYLIVLICNLIFYSIYTI